MSVNLLKSILFSLGLLISHLQLYGQSTIQMTVDADRSMAKIQASMWGLFFEDINFAVDGGIYAELVKNRSFEFPDPLEGWTVEGSSFFNRPLQIINRGNESSSNPRVARIQVNDSISLVNSGFRGMGIKENEPYTFSILASLISGNIKIQAILLGEKGQEIGKTIIDPEGEWRKYESVFEAQDTEGKAGLKLCFEGNGVIDIDMVSLFPVNTWKNRPNGLRADLVQKLADLEPGFLRFPGGCIVEGRDLSKRYQWKNTLGNLEDRKLMINRWNDENSRATPDYFQSFGLGFYEFFLLAEDLNAEPVPILNCGMACQFNTGEVVAMDSMHRYIQDALDLIEFANGPIDSKWGGIRGRMGHPEPFHMKFLGIGNEQWGARYFERYKLFEKEIGEKYPEIMLISSTGPMASGPLFDYNKRELKKYNPALVDEHYYNSPEWFFNNATRYDDYDRNSYKIFAGEYAAANVRMASPENRNVWETALSEAAFMTGLERNADVVFLASYAPLLAHTEAWQWTPDLIWFDNLNVYGTPNYYVQKLFATHSGTDVLSIHREGDALTGKDGIYASAVRDENSKEIIVKLVNRNETAQSVKIDLDTGKKLASRASMIVLQSNDLAAVNTLEDPQNISPRQEEITISQKDCKLSLDPYSLTVILMKQK